MVAVQNYHGNPAPPGKPVLTFQTGDVIELLRGDPETQWWEVGPGARRGRAEGQGPSPVEGGRLSARPQFHPRQEFWESPALLSRDKCSVPSRVPPICPPPGSASATLCPPPAYLPRTGPLSEGAVRRRAGPGRGGTPWLRPTTFPPGSATWGSRDRRGHGQCPRWLRF